MARQKRVVAGKKFSRRHTTVATDLAKRVCELAVVLMGVKKITPGYIKTGLSNRVLRVVFWPMTGGVLIKVVAAASAQEIRVYGSDPPKDLAENLQQVFSGDKRFRTVKFESRIE